MDESPPAASPTAPVRTAPAHLAAESKRAAQQGDLKRLKTFVAEHGLDALSEKDAVMGRTAIHLACEHGRCSIVQYLIELQHGDLNLPDVNQVTPLHLAASRNHADIVRLLLREGAHADAKDLHGDLPIHWAASKGHIEVIQLLGSHITGAADIDASGPSGWSPLHRAAHGGHVQAVDTLLQLGASPNCRNSDGNTPLHLAAEAHLLPVMEVLLARGASVDLTNLQGSTPLGLCSSPEARQLCEDEQWWRLREQVMEQEQREKERQERERRQEVFRMLSTSMSARTLEVQAQEASAAEFPDLDVECDADADVDTLHLLGLPPPALSFNARRRSDMLPHPCLSASELNLLQSWYRHHEQRGMGQATKLTTRTEDGRNRVLLEAGSTPAGAPPVIPESPRRKEGPGVQKDASPCPALCLDRRASSYQPWRREGEWDARRAGLGAGRRRNSLDSAPLICAAPVVGSSLLSPTAGAGQLRPRRSLAPAPSHAPRTPAHHASLGSRTRPTALPLHSCSSSPSAVDPLHSCPTLPPCTSPRWAAPRRT